MKLRLAVMALLLTLGPAFADGGPRPDPRVTQPPRICKPGAGYVHQPASGDDGQQGGYGDKQYGGYGQQGGYGDKQYGGYEQQGGYGDKSQYGGYGQKAGYGSSDGGLPVPDSIRNWKSGAETWGQNK